MSEGNRLNLGMLNTAATLIVICLTVYILIIGKSILVPLVAAVVIWYLMVRLAASFSKTPLVGKRMPDGIALTLAIISTILIVTIFINLVGNSINGIIEEAPLYQEKIRELVAFINNLFGSSFDLNKVVSKLNFASLFSNLAVGLAGMAGNLGIISVYVIFLLLEYKTFDSKLKVIARNEKNLKKMREIFSQTTTDINTYMKIKAGVSLLTATLSFVALFIFAVPYAQFWAVLIFVLNFIPTIGSFIAIAVTLLAVSIHFTTLTPFLILGGILIAIQFAIGSILEPKLMGKNLNLSPLVILLSLAFWGSIWGIIGMFLCVPLMTIINIVLSKFESTRPLAVLLAADPGIVKS